MPAPKEPAKTEDDVTPVVPAAAPAASGYINVYPQPIAVLLASDDPKAEPTRAVIQPGSQIPGAVDPLDLDRLVAVGYAKPATV